jgi:hypothetical protein
MAGVLWNLLGRTNKPPEVHDGRGRRKCMKIVINNCFGGYGLSHKAIMLYADKVGLELYAFVETRYSNGTLTPKYMPYKEGDKAFIVHYATKPLKDGKYQEGTFWNVDNIERTDPNLIEVVQELGDEASDKYADLKIIEIPDGIEYIIEEYDGLESVHEAHRSWS